MNTTEKMGLTVREASHYSGLGEHLLRRLVKAQKLPALLVGQKVVIRRDRLDEFMSINDGSNLLDLPSVKSLTLSAV